jgi:TrmH family RNA methyltransferase
MEPVRFILVRPGTGGNVGAAARALKNMGLGELWLVDARPFDAAEAERFAHGAADVLGRARRTATLDAALADCRWVVGTTRRAGRRRGDLCAPRAWAEAVHAHPERAPVAVVFGPEEDGLSAPELARCQALVRIPSHPAQPSLNLAQAVLVLAYEWYVAAGAAPAVAARGEAAAAELEGLYAHLESALRRVGFARPETAPAKLLAFRRLFGRTRLTPAEVRLLRGLCRQILWAVEPAAGAKPARKPGAAARLRRPPAPRPRAPRRDAPV